MNSSRLLLIMLYHAFFLVSILQPVLLQASVENTMKATIKDVKPPVSAAEGPIAQ